MSVETGDVVTRPQAGPGGCTVVLLDGEDQSPCPGIVVADVVTACRLGHSEPDSICDPCLRDAENGDLWCPHCRFESRSFLAAVVPR